MMHKLIKPQSQQQIHTGSLRNERKSKIVGLCFNTVKNKKEFLLPENMLTNMD